MGVCVPQGWVLGAWVLLRTRGSELGKGANEVTKSARHTKLLRLIKIRRPTVRAGEGPCDTKWLNVTNEVWR